MAELQPIYGFNHPQLNILPVEYRDVPGFPGYRVSSIGTVWSCRKADKGVGTWALMSPQVDRWGYLYVGLSRSGKKSARFLHRIVLLSFIGPCPEGMEACHAPDPSPLNCRLSNLRWDTQENNMNDRRLFSGGIAGTGGSFRKGVKHEYCAGSRHPRAKLKESDIPVIRARHASGESQSAIARDYGVHRARVCQIVKGESWQHVT